MTLEKILITVGEKEYSLTVEILPDEDETIYRATPDQAEPLLEGISAGYIDFDEKGNRQYESVEEESSEKGKEIADAIWRGIKEQIIDAHSSF
jgi:hypothetical protein